MQRDPLATIGQQYVDITPDEYDWHGTWPLVEVAPDGTVGAIVALVSEGSEWTTVRIQDGRVAESGPFSSDAAALLCELIDAGLYSEEVL